LFHGFVNRHAIGWSHLVELVSLNNPTVRQHHNLLQIKFSLGVTRTTDAVKPAAELPARYGTGCDFGNKLEVTLAILGSQQEHINVTRVARRRKLPRLTW
jgi:hypothetical protein